MIRWLGLATFSLVLGGCLPQPDTSELCFENRQLVWDVCEVDTTPEDEDFALQQCQRDAGFAVATRCAHEVKTLLECVAEASAGADCEDLAFAGEDCAFEQGRAEGCLSR